MKSPNVWIVGVGASTGRLQPAYVKRIEAQRDEEPFWEKYEDAKAESDRQQAARERDQFDANQLAKLLQ